MSLNASVQFFEAQFQCQAQGEERVLNPFEQAALPHLQGQVLDFGCFATVVARKPGAAGVWSTRAGPMPTRAAVPRPDRGLREPMAPMAAVPQSG